MHLPGHRARPLAGRLVLLAPSRRDVPRRFRNVVEDEEFHAYLLGRVQRLRGDVYLRDNAIDTAQLTTDGRHCQVADERSWHIVSMQGEDRVTGCARYRSYPRGISPEQLGVWSSALAQHAHWSLPLRSAVAREIDDARRRGVSYVEVGGWAVDDPFRFSAEGVTVALSAFALARALGGCLGLTTATVKNASSRILRKIGGRPVEDAGVPLPPYYDPHYRCDMEILRFDSAAPGPRFEETIATLASQFGDLPVICAEPGLSVPARERSARGLRASADWRRPVAVERVPSTPADR